MHLEYIWKFTIALWLHFRCLIQNLLFDYKLFIVAIHKWIRLISVYSSYALCLLFDILFRCNKRIILRNIQNQGSSDNSALLSRTVSI